MVRWAACSLAAACLTGAPALQAQKFSPQIEARPVERYTLANGLRVVLAPDPMQPTIAGAVAYRVGLRDDPEDYRGLAHLVEHMTFRGSRHLEDGAAFTHLESIGASVNAVTMQDATVYFAQFGAQFLPRFLWVESERMAFTLEAMTAERLAIERRVVQNESRQRDPAGSQVRIDARHAAYPEGHPYRNVGDAEQDVVEMQLDDVRWFFQQHYRPDNATLVLVGNFEVPAARALIEQWFGPLRASGELRVRKPAPAVQFRGTQRLDFAARYRHDELHVRWKIACNADVRCHAQLEVLEKLLVGHGGARLERAVAHGLATDVDFRRTYGEHDLELDVTAEIPVASDPDRVLAAIDRVLDAIRLGKITDAQLREAQLAAATELLYADESLLRRALLHAVRPELDLPALVQAVMLLSAQDVAGAVPRLLPRDRRLILAIEARKTAPVEGELTSDEGALLPQVVAPVPRTELTAGAPP